LAFPPFSGSKAVAAGLPPLTAQYEVYGVHEHRGRVLLGRVDLAYPRWRIAIEYKGDHHRKRARFQRDVARLNALRAAGWLVLRFTADDTLRHPARIVRLVLGAIEERSS
jgi:very-short-patch-repair endonuclease